MQKYISLLLFISLVFASHTVFSVEDEKESEAALIQKYVNESTKFLNESSHVINATWTNSYTIDIIYNDDYLKYLNKKEIEEQTLSQAFSFYMIKLEPTCARISDQDGNELAYKCYGAEGL